MIMSSRKMVILVVATAAFAGGLFWNGKSTFDAGLVSEAEARIGRPLTPMSYAGVARRTTRRAVAGAAVVRGAAAAGAYYGSSCAQVVDAYGQVYTRC
jgi:hypothetical protein